MNLEELVDISVLDSTIRGLGIAPGPGRWRLYRRCTSFYHRRGMYGETHVLIDIFVELGTKYITLWLYPVNDARPATIMLRIDLDLKGGWIIGSSSTRLMRG